MQIEWRGDNNNEEMKILSNFGVWWTIPFGFIFFFFFVAASTVLHTIYIDSLTFFSHFIVFHFSKRQQCITYTHLYIKSGGSFLEGIRKTRKRNIKFTDDTYSFYYLPLAVREHQAMLKEKKIRILIFHLLWQLAKCASKARWVVA